MKTDFASKFLLLLQPACSIAKRENDIIETFTEKKDFQLKESEFLSLLSGAFMKQTFKEWKYKPANSCLHRNTRGRYVLIFPERNKLHSYDGLSSHS